MARARTIRPTFFTHDSLAQMNPLARLLFAGLWCEADRMGRLEDRPVQLKIRYLPLDLHEVPPLLDLLEHAKLIVRYVIDERRLIWIPGFVEQQHGHIHPNEARSELPPHPLDSNEESGPRPKRTRSANPRGSPRSSTRSTKVIISRAGSSGSSGSSLVDDAGEQPTARKPSGQQQVFAELQESRTEKLLELGLDPEPDKEFSPAFINTTLNKIRDRAGGDPVAVVDVHDRYLAESWPADKKPPYTFQVFASEKVWGKLLEQMQPGRDS
jgi:hypothetical protein